MTEKHKKPFFLAVGIVKPHLPFDAPVRFFDQLPTDITIDNYKADDLNDIPKVGKSLPKKGEFNYYLSNNVWDKVRRAYLASISWADYNIGRVIDALLSELEIKDNTLIVFISDNGGVTAEFADNSPYRGYKGMLFEGGIRVPFCISWKGKIPKNKIYNEMVSSLDIFPTFLSVTGVKTSISLDGENLLPYLNNEISTPPHEQLFWRTAGGASYAIRKGEFKLTKRMYNENLMLFDLINDPKEIHDISKQFPKKVKDLKEHYNLWNDQMIDPLWTKDGHVPKTKERLDTYNKIREKASLGEKQTSK